MAAEKAVLYVDGSSMSILKVFVKASTLGGATGAEGKVLIMEVVFETGGTNPMLPKF